MIRRYFAILIIIFCTWGAFAQDQYSDTTIMIAGTTPENTAVLSPEVQIDSATKDYNNGLYRQSLEGYQAVIDAGYESSELYYNAGNAAFKINELALAILYYEKSLKLKPNDEDVKYNLGLINSRIPDKIETVPEMFLMRWIKDFRQLLSADQWAYCSIAFFTLALFLLAFYFLSRNMGLRKIGFWVGLIMLIIAAVSFISSKIETNNLINSDSAIVFSPSVTIKSSPTDGSTNIFVLHEGTKVFVIETIDEWCKIKIADGSVGWLPQKTIRLI